jgi:hypothetical protein
MLPFEGMQYSGGYQGLKHFQKESLRNASGSGDVVRSHQAILFFGGQENQGIDGISGSAGELHGSFAAVLVQDG